MNVLLFLVLLPTTLATNNSFQTLFPNQNKQYVFRIRSNITTGSETPTVEASYWTMDGYLHVQVYDQFSRARFILSKIKNSAGNSYQKSTHQTVEAAELEKSWEVGVCFSSIFIHAEPTWATNIKRALSFNFLVADPTTAVSGDYEPCLHGSCFVVYTKVGGQTRKYSRQEYQTIVPGYGQACASSLSDVWRPGYSEDRNHIMTAERLYDIDKNGLNNLNVKSDLQYRFRDNILAVSTELTLTLEREITVQSIQKMDLIEKPLQYEYHNASNPSNGIWTRSQDTLHDQTFELVTKIANKIDVDNIMRDPSLIHSLDFIELLSKMSQLSYTTLKILYKDLLGTSYELETSRNIFLEVLPYVRTEASARLVKYLIIEQKKRIEDATLLALIRKLPFNTLAFSRGLLEKLEVLTKLGPDYPQDIRHAGILSFSTLVYKTMEANYDQQYFDDIYDKYLRMYNNCPQYIDRMVWLQGLTNIARGAISYLDEIHGDHSKDRHERLWASFGTLSIWKELSKHTIPTIYNTSEHIQLRTLALHTFLSCSSVVSRDFMNMHSYIQGCQNEVLQKFWHSSMRSLEKNRLFSSYRAASHYVPFIAHNVKDPGVKYWATNNFILAQDPYLDTPGATLQVFTVGGHLGGLPEMIVLEFSTGGDQPLNCGVYIIAEGITFNLFKRTQNFNLTDWGSETLFKELKKLNIKVVEPQKVHIDIVVKIQDKTVYATHFDHERFSKWTIEDLTNSFLEFVRFGSHINQQIVYYPIQDTNNFPTELGTPIKYDSTSISFFSIRGNLSSLEGHEGINWINDLHIRYQGAFVSSISTDGALQPSEHTVRMQQSAVVHLPIRFYVDVAKELNRIQMLWTNPTQNGGAAVHARTQIEVTTHTGVHINDKDGGVFFDCPLAETGYLDNIKENLFSTFERSDSFLKNLQSTFLDGINLLFSPKGSCGVILPPKQLESGNQLNVTLGLEEFLWNESPKNDGHVAEYENKIDAHVKYTLVYSRPPSVGDPKTFLMVHGQTKLVTDGQNGTFTMELNSQYPESEDPALKNWSFCLHGEHNTVNHFFGDDFKANITSYNSIIKLNYSNEENFTCFTSVPSRTININLSSTAWMKEDGQLLRKWKINMDSNTPSENSSQPTFLEVYEENCQAKVNVNGSFKDMQSSLFQWLPYSWTSLQGLKHFGFYQQCRIVNGSRIRTFSGKVVHIPYSYNNLLAVGECTEDPRFAVTVLSFKNSVTLHVGNLSISSLHKDDVPLTSNTTWSSLSEFGKSDQNTTTLLRSKSTGVHIFYEHTAKETIILMPSVYLPTACGVCIEDFTEDGH